MAHKPPCGYRSVTKLHPNRFKTENTLTKTLDSKVGFMRLLGRTFSYATPLALTDTLGSSNAQSDMTNSGRCRMPIHLSCGLKK
jgi:hypothetical protein